MKDLSEVLGEAKESADLSDAALADAEQALTNLFDEIRAGKIEEVKSDDTARLRTITEAIQSIRDEAATRIALADAKNVEAAELESIIRPVSDEVVAEVIVETEEVVAEAEEILADAPELVTASAEPEIVSPSPSLSDLAALRPAHAAPVVTMPAVENSIRSLSDGRDLSIREFANLVIERREDFGAFSGEGSERVRLGRQTLDMDESRTLNRNDSTSTNTEKIEAVVASAMNPSEWSDSIVASGGFCAPTDTSYSVEQISGAQRPVRDALPRFMADRGGIRFVTPPDLSDILVNTAGGAVGAWDNVTDITPGESIKSTQTVACGEIVEALTQAIYRSLQFGNFTSRAFPEWVEVWIKNAAAAHARFAETELLDGIDANSTPVSTTQVLGTTRDLLAYVAQLAAAERNRQRLSPDARFRALLPAWVVQSIQQDILRQGNIELKIPTEQSIRSWFSQLGVNVAFYEDTRTGAGQQVAAQGAGADLRDLPSTVEWYLFNEGSHVFLDGGVLDLGLVRDSTLNKTNDYKLFVETFEGVAFRGLFSYRVRSAICAAGTAALPVSSAAICAAS